MTPKPKPAPPAERVREKHGMAEISAERAARILGISRDDVLSLVASGELRSTRTDPIDSPIIGYDSVIDYIVRLRAGMVR